MITCCRCSRIGKRKRATWPIEDPKFCSKNCALQCAIENTMDDVFCVKHEEWYTRTESCYYCDEEAEGALSCPQSD